MPLTLTLTLTLSGGRGLSSGRGPSGAWPSGHVTALDQSEFVVRTLIFTLLASPTSKPSNGDFLGKRV